jgi:hypothetical protein
MNRSELLRALYEAHKGHNLFQGGNFLDCYHCGLHVMYRGQALTWVPRGGRKEREILTIVDVQRTVRP